MAAKLPVSLTRKDRDRSTSQTRVRKSVNAVVEPADPAQAQVLCARRGLRAIFRHRISL